MARIYSSAGARKLPRRRKAAPDEWRIWDSYCDYCWCSGLDLTSGLLPRRDL